MVNTDELELIAAYLYITRLGQTRYKHAAFSLIQAIEDSYGDDFTENAAIMVDLHVQILDEDDCDTVLEEYDAVRIALDVS